MLAAGLIAAGMSGYQRHPHDPWLLSGVYFTLFMIGLSWYVRMIVDERRK
jgi:hypothetical protein